MRDIAALGKEFDESGRGIAVSYTHLDVYKRQVVYDGGKLFFLFFRDVFLGSEQVGESHDGIKRSTDFMGFLYKRDKG